MNKAQLRNLIESINSGDTCAVHFRSNPGPQTYTVIEKFTGRGKGGSRHVVLEASDGTHISIGTPNNEAILSMSTNGVFAGSTSDRADLPPAEINLPLAMEIKARMRSLTGEPGVGRKVRLVPVDPANEMLNGEFTIQSSRVTKGRYGQVCMELVPVNGPVFTPITFWSHRNSGLLTEFTVVPEEGFRRDESSTDE